MLSSPASYQQQQHDIEMDDFETRATRQRMNALMGEIHGDSDED